MIAAEILGTRCLSDITIVMIIILGLTKTDHPVLRLLICTEESRHRFSRLLFRRDRVQCGGVTFDRHLWDDHHTAYLGHRGKTTVVRKRGCWRVISIDNDYHSWLLSWTPEVRHRSALLGLALNMHKEENKAYWNRYRRM
jgi:hypothetical protein